ncbi:flagellin [Coralloluteibacterium stylophorae]|uniref:Flagellin n=1 Tax=Coralloluteibacterium stylophorae TaxID=1776034 RepID=A0AAP2CB61_9GAMM|nr:flagellin [Coralloluteibacterium stylophorae]MBS7457205.1 flagellin [Coralloluteibacterium stylophorae]
MQVINTNVMSLNSQRHLNNSSSALATSIERLSSGSRINSAKDDAAGLAISERFTTQIRGMDQAARNANDGISLAQTAEGALGEIGNNLQRIRELAVQSRNATNSASDREALDAEVTQLKAEIQRVAEQTEFNGTKLLDGTFSDAVFQVGANQGQTITVDAIANANTAQLGSWTSPSTTTYTQTTAAATATAFATGMSLDINGVTISTADGAADAAAATTALVAAFDAAKANPANTALANVTMAADGSITSTDQNLTLANLTNVSGVAAGTTAGTPSTVAGTAQTGFETENVLTTDAADRMILAMDAALNAVNASRADLGAVQNRFTSVVANLQTSSENLSASRSRIKDADFAKETAEMTRTQILQQAGTAMLAQANQAPQGVMSLLR